MVSSSARPAAGSPFPRRSALSRTTTGGLYTGPIWRSLNRSRTTSRRHCRSSGNTLRRLEGPYGSTLSAKETSGQLLITKACLSTGVALRALDNPAMKSAFLHFGLKFPSSTHLKNYIPFILQEEEETVLKELGKGNSYAVVFDGTPYRCECFGIGIRFIGSDGKICQRLLSLSMLEKSMDFGAIFGEIFNILYNKFKLDTDCCVGFMLDGCAANMVALDALTTMH